jgi:hypothetical protein
MSILVTIILAAKPYAQDGFDEKEGGHSVISISDSIFDGFSWTTHKRNADQCPPRGDVQYIV